MIDEKVKRFFETHNSSKALTLPDMTPEVLEDMSNQIEPILLRSPVLVRVFDLDGVKNNRDSMRTLLSCVYHVKCVQCDTPPVIFEVYVFHPEGIISFFEDKSVSIPQEYSWPIYEGCHFLINCRCSKCEDTFFGVATYIHEIGQFINAYAMSVSDIKDAYRDEMGFIVRYSWIKSYFEKKKFDKKFLQKTTLACIKHYHTLKKAPKTRYQSNESFYLETGEGILDVTRNLIPQITTEKEFCSLIKGVHLFYMMEAGDRIFQFESLDPSVRHFSLTKIQQEFKTIAPTIPNEEKKVFLATAILTVNTAYQELTSMPIPLPKWVSVYLDD
ncbi:MAG: hypothetical protein ACFFB5_11805 [Promethearchaeota archaeon]